MTKFENDNEKKNWNFILPVRFGKFFCLYNAIVWVHDRLSVPIVSAWNENLEIKIHGHEFFFDSFFDAPVKKKSFPSFKIQMIWIHPNASKGDFDSWLEQFMVDSCIVRKIRLDQRNYGCSYMSSWPWIFAYNRILSYSLATVTRFEFSTTIYLRLSGVW